MFVCVRTRLTSLEVQSFLVDICEGHGLTFVVIDAIDECSISRERGLILSALKKLTKSSTKVVITGRPSLEDVNNCLANYLSIRVVASDNDIRNYLEERISENTKFKTRIVSVDGLVEQTITKIVLSASGM